jgi:hypothetical protein
MKAVCLDSNIFNNSSQHKLQLREHLNNLQLALGQRPLASCLVLELERKISVRWVWALNQLSMELKLLLNQQLEGSLMELHLEVALSLEQPQQLEEILLLVVLEEAHPRLVVLVVELELEALLLVKPLPSVALEEPLVQEDYSVLQLLLQLQQMILTISLST